MPTPEHEGYVRRVEAFAIPNFPYVRLDDNIGAVVFEFAKRADIHFQQKDIIVIAQKIVSRSEGRVKLLRDVVVSKEALELSRLSGKDPKICQLILEDSKQVLYANERAIITEHISGLVSGSAGLDTTNVNSENTEAAILLPVDSDESAKRIRRELIRLSGKNIATIITDSIGRPFRKGSVGMSIGFSGISALERIRSKDLFGKNIYQEVALVDEVSAMASTLMGEANEGNPVIIVRGVNYTIDELEGFKNIIRSPSEDQIWP